MTDQQIRLANQAAIQISENLPSDVSGPAWTQFSDILSQLHDKIIEYVNEGQTEFQDVEAVVADLVQKAGALAGKANDGTLDTDADGAEIATVLNAARQVPNYMAGV